MAVLNFDATKIPLPPAKPFRLTFGRSRSEVRWTDQRDLDWEELCGLFAHAPVGEKDGPCYTPAIFLGPARKKDQALRIDVAVLDADCGHTLEEIEGALTAQGWRGIIHSTHSHLSTRSYIAAIAFDGWQAANPDGTVAEYMATKKGYLPRVVAGAEIVDHDDIAGTRLHIVEHNPCPKYRVLVPLAAPWLAADYETGQLASVMWRAKVRALAYALRLHTDQSCVDTSRLFYLPRRATEEQPYVLRTLEGAACPIWGLPEAPEAADGGMSSRGRLPAGRAARGSQGHRIFVGRDGRSFDLTEWAAKYAVRYEIVRALKARAPHMLGWRRTGSKQHLECPNAARHTSGEADRTGTYAVNASELAQADLQERGEGFVLHCMHSGCAGLDRLDHVAALLTSGALRPEDLTRPEFLTTERPILGGDLMQALRESAPGGGDTADHPPERQIPAFDVESWGKAGVESSKAGDESSKAGDEGEEAWAAGDPEEELDQGEPAELGIGENRGVIPPELMDNLPGPMGLMFDWILAGSHRSQPILALAGALALVAGTIGQRVKLQDLNTRPNVYLVGIAYTGSGKERPKSAIKEVVRCAGLSEQLLGVSRVASDAGIIAAIAAAPRHIMLIDEIGDLIHNVGAKGVGAALAAVPATLLDLYSSSHTTFETKSYADITKVKRIDQPCVSLLGFTTPAGLVSALKTADITGGLLSRVVLFDAGDYLPPSNSKRFDGRPPQGLLDWMIAWNKVDPIVDKFHREGGEQLLEPRLIVMTPEAAAIAERFGVEMDARMVRARERGVDAVYARARENALKFAMAWACCGPLVPSPAGPAVDEAALCVDEAAMRWAVALSRATVESMARLATQIADTTFACWLKDLEEAVRRGKGRGATMREIKNVAAGKHPPGLLDDLLTHLNDAGRIFHVDNVHPGRRGRPRAAWVHIAFRASFPPDEDEDGG